jgi:hypothetical protein
VTAAKEKKSETISRRGGKRPGAGRPKGRKDAKTLEIEAAAKEYAGDALRALVKVARRGKSEGSRVAAAVALLDRGYGRPRQSLEHSGPDGGPIDVRTNELRDRITRRIDGIASRIGTNGVTSIAHAGGTRGAGA